MQSFAWKPRPSTQTLVAMASVQTYRSKRITRTQLDYIRHSMSLRQNCDQSAPASNHCPPNKWDLEAPDTSGVWHKTAIIAINVPLLPKQPSPDRKIIPRDKSGCNFTHLSRTLYAHAISNVQIPAENDSVSASDLRPGCHIDFPDSSEKQSRQNYQAHKADSAYRLTKLIWNCWKI